MAALRQLLYVLALIVPAYALAPPALAQPGSPSSGPSASLERQVKAAYLYKFAGFVEWPESSFKAGDSALAIGVAGSDLLADQLERMVAGRTVNGHPVVVRRMRAGDSPAGLHILFADHSLERSVLGAMMAAARGHSVLTVTDAEDALAHGAMIGFVVADDRLRFEVGLKLAQSSGLRISARMLAVAHKVQGAS